MLVLGGLFLAGNSAVNSMFKKLPRSQTAAYLFFGSGALWFLYHVWHLSDADFGQFKKPLFVGFALVAGLSFKFVPDFLAVRGLSVLTLMGALPLLMAGYLNFDYWYIYVYKVYVYIAIILAIYLGASPFRLRDFFEWLFQVRGRARALGGLLAASGLLLSVVAFTY